MSHHRHHTGQIIEGAALGLLAGAAISEDQQHHPGRSYGASAAKTGSSMVVGSVVGLLAFGWITWGLLMHPLITIPLLFVLAFLIHWARQPATVQPPAPVPDPLEGYPVTIAAHAPRDFLPAAQHLRVGDRYRGPGTGVRD